MSLVHVSFAVQSLRHVVTTKREVNHASTLVAPLPAFVLGKLQCLLHSFVLGTIATVLSCLALDAGRFAACRTGGDVVVDEGSSDKF